MQLLSSEKYPPFSKLVKLNFSTVVAELLMVFNLQMDQVAWAIDLKLRYSDSLAMARLMCYVSAGHFDPSLSAFTLPVKTTRERRRQRRQTFDQDMVSVID